MFTFLLRTQSSPEDFSCDSTIKAKTVDRNAIVAVCSSSISIEVFCCARENCNHRFTVPGDDRCDELKSVWSRSHNKISHAVYVAPSFCFYSFFFCEKGQEKTELNKSCTIILVCDSLCIYLFAERVSYARLPAKPGGPHNHENWIINPQNNRAKEKSSFLCWCGALKL